MMNSDLINKETASVESTEQLPIRYDVYHPKDSTPSKLPVILFLPGFKGFKDWGTFPTICRRLAQSGFVVVAMNFSLNGIGENPLEFDRLDLFARETFTQDLADVGTVLKGIDVGEIKAGDQTLNPDKIGILGHSRGGQTAVAAAAEYPEITCLVTWSAVADYNARWSDEMKSDWQMKGVTEIKNGRTGQIMPMKKIIYDDAMKNADRVIALNRIDEVKIPFLIVHSKDDEAVPYQNAEQLFKASPSPHKKLMPLEKTGHTFGGAHPFKADEFPEPLQKAFSKSKDWFKMYLK